MKDIYQGYPTLTQFGAWFLKASESCNQELVSFSIVDVISSTFGLPQIPKRSDVHGNSNELLHESLHKFESTTNSDPRVLACVEARHRPTRRRQNESYVLNYYHHNKFRQHIINKSVGPSRE